MLQPLLLERSMLGDRQTIRLIRRWGGPSSWVCGEDKVKKLPDDNNNAALIIVIFNI
jgi:hypothetical protein